MVDNKITTAWFDKQVSSDTWMAAAAEASRRAGAAICDGKVRDALDWQDKGKRWARNSYIAVSTGA